MQAVSFTDMLSRWSVQFASILLALFLTACDSQDSGSLEKSAAGFRWEPVPVGMILTRNFMVPRSPEKEGYRLLPEKYRLGSKAYAKAVPEWWLQMVIDTKLDDMWHLKDFPLAYAGEFKADDGSVLLLVVQVSQGFSGDGFLSPGPEIYLVARLFSEGEGSPKLLTEKFWTLDGSFQYSRLFSGEANGREILFRTESGRYFDSNEVTGKKNWKLGLADDNSMLFQEID